MHEITKKEIKHLAELARLDVNEKDEAKLERDLSEILNYFNELKEVNVEDVSPLTGVTNLINAVREDDTERTADTLKGKESFPPGGEDGYLKVPSVF